MYKDIKARFESRLEESRKDNTLIMAKLEPYVGDYYLWEYIPSLPASIIFVLLFLAATLFHCWKAWKSRARFCIPFCIGGICTFYPPVRLASSPR